MIKFFKYLENIFRNFHKVLLRFPCLISSYLKLRDSVILNICRPQKTSYGFNLYSYSPVADYEHEDTDLIMGELKNYDVFIDVGANIGFYSCLARSIDKKVLAIEPMKQNLAFIRKNLKINNWIDVDVLPIGIASSPGKAEIYGACTGASLVKNWSGVPESWKDTVTVDTLDNCLEGRFIDNKLLIKVDVEGLEYDLLQGAKKTLDRNIRPAWIVEICFKENYPDGVNPHFSDTFQVFWKNGYLSYTLDNGVVEVKPSDVERWIKNNKRDFGIVTFLFKPSKP